MATSKANRPATTAAAAAAATTGAAAASSTETTDKGVNNEQAQTPAGGAAAPGGAAADDGAAAQSAGDLAVGAVQTGEAAGAASAVASADTPAALAPVGGDDVQAPATGDAGRAASSSFALPPMSELLERLRSLEPEDLAFAREHARVVSDALATLDAERQGSPGLELSMGDAVASKPPAPQSRAVVLFSAGALRHSVGDLVEGTEQAINSLAQSGDVDRHPDAVAAAEARGATVHQLGA